MRIHLDHVRRPRRMTRPVMRPLSIGLAVAVLGITTTGAAAGPPQGHVSTGAEAAVSSTDSVVVRVDTFTDLCPSTADGIAGWMSSVTDSSCKAQPQQVSRKPLLWQLPSQCPRTADAITAWLVAPGPNACKRELRDGGDWRS